MRCPAAILWGGDAFQIRKQVWRVTHPLVSSPGGTPTCSPARKSKPARHGVHTHHLTVHGPPPTPTELLSAGNAREERGFAPPPPEEAHQVIGGGLLEGRDCPWAESYAMFALPFLCKGLISARGVATLSISILRGTQTIALKKDFILETPTTRPASRAAAVLGLPPYRRSNANSSVSQTCSRC